MAQPVWVLSVDLQTKSATFVSGMADAAKGARGSFNDIKQGAAEAGKETGASMTEARHSVMILGEEFGVKIPRALAGFVASLGPIAGVMESAFPFAAIALGATLFIEHLHKAKEEAEKLAESQEKFHTTAHNAFNALDQKLLQAQIHADELNKNHLAALHHQLEMIDRQSMDELVHSFETVSKAADEVFAHLKTSWYEMGVGSQGAQHALTKFKGEYDALLAAGKSGEASDLLAGTLHSAERVLALQKQFVDNQSLAETGKNRQGLAADYQKFVEAHSELKKLGLDGGNEKEVQSQQALVDVLKTQLEIEGKVAELKRTQSSNATKTVGNEMAAEAERALFAQIRSEQAAEAAQDRLREENRQRRITEIEEEQKEIIAATEKGTTARLAAIDAGIKVANNKGLQETSFYRSLLTSRVETVREMATEEARLQAEAGKQAAEHGQKMSELQLAADQEAARVRMSAKRVTIQELIDQEVLAANQEFAIKQQAFEREIQALDRHAKDYQNKLKALQDKETELVRQHENQVTQIRDKAEIDRNQKSLSAMNQLVSMTSTGLANVIMRHETMAAMLESIGDKVLTGMLENTIRSLLLLDFDREKTAAKAARTAYTWGWEHGGPAAPALATTMGALAFAATMAFAEGGIVPGVGRGDIVPAMLTPGEHVADKELTNGLRSMVRNGGADNRPHITLHVRPTYNVNTIDGDGMRDALDKHSDELERRMSQMVRRFNY